jgi:hypothetical protein
LEGLFPKEAVVALATVSGADESEVLVAARSLIGTLVRRELCPLVMTFECNIAFPFLRRLSSRSNAMVLLLGETVTT